MPGSYKKLSKPRCINTTTVHTPLASLVLPSLIAFLQCPTMSSFTLPLLVFVNWKLLIQIFSSQTYNYKPTADFRKHTASSHTPTSTPSKNRSLTRRCDKLQTVTRREYT